MPAYCEALKLVEIEPILVIAGKTQALPSVKGWLLPGGDDMNPARYGQKPHPKTGLWHDEVDELCARIIEREILAKGIPSFHICLGMQQLNVASGGTLNQHLKRLDIHEKRTDDKSLSAHEILLWDESKVFSIIGQTSIQVNSRHHQAIGILGSGLKICAEADDQVVEAIELPDHPFCIGFQSHPENRVHRHAPERALFQAFANAL